MADKIVVLDAAKLPPIVSWGSSPEDVISVTGVVPNPDDIADVISSWTGIPAGRLLEGETEKLLRMEEWIGRRLIGQGEAVRAGRRPGGVSPRGTAR